MRYTLAIVLSLSGVAGYGSTRSPKPAQVPSPPPPAQDSLVRVRADTGAKRASLARRLAEAADGYRDSTRRWFVVDRNFPHRVALALEEKDTARAQDSLRRLIQAKEVPPTCEYADCDYRLYGPFFTP